MHAGSKFYHICLKYSWDLQILVDFAPTKKKIAVDFDNLTSKAVTGIDVPAAALCTMNINVLNIRSLSNPKKLVKPDKGDSMLGIVVHVGGDRNWYISVLQFPFH